MPSHLGLLALLCLVPCAARTQTITSEQGAYRLQVQSRLVNTTLLVRGPDGKPVTGLPQTAFHVREDGADQTIRYFGTERDLPLSIGLIVDASGSQEKFVKEHEREIQGFLTEVLQPNDRAFAVCFGNHLRLTTDWTGSPQAIIDGVHRFGKGDRSFPEVGPVEERELGTALYDAIVFPLQEKMATQTGRRRVLIIFSDGEENSSEHDLIDAIDEAQTTDTLVYALRTTENPEKKMDARDRYGERVLDHLTDATGGRSFDARLMSPKEIFSSIAADLRSLYEIGFYSSHGDRDRGFRKVTITVDGSDLRVQARSGYVAGSRPARTSH